ncbi:hypothetical protein J0S82_015910 [Galemys pyrenaicus]|uniref:Uncharacterized protein n=1 Tax=Galemys pyrenaicus TaxID=202257 RepID=A0A8J6AHA5_GALPY|nr:hypothetical protein J0S82_015910 [Galemys pyrenaicus]
MATSEFFLLGLSEVPEHQSVLSSLSSVYGNPLIVGVVGSTPALHTLRHVFIAGPSCADLSPPLALCRRRCPVYFLSVSRAGQCPLGGDDGT